MKNKSIFITGHRGMLGNCAVKFFKSKGFDVHTTDLRWNKNDDAYLNAIKKSGCEWIINCMSIIPSSFEFSLLTLEKFNNEIYNINSLFPAMLYGTGKKIIHPGTNAEFINLNKRDKFYIEERGNSDSIYGISKILSTEFFRCRPNSYVIRASIVGIETAPFTKSLINKLFKLKNNSIMGWENFNWNGITTLEWVKIANNIILGVNGDHNMRNHPHLIQPSTAIISKYQLICDINSIFELSIDVQRETILPEDDMIKNSVCMDSDGIYYERDIKKLLTELREFYEI